MDEGKGYFDIVLLGLFCDDENFCDKQIWTYDAAVIIIITCKL